MLFARYKIQLGGTTSVGFGFFRGSVVWYTQKSRDPITRLGAPTKHYSTPECNGGAPPWAAALCDQLNGLLQVRDRSRADTILYEKYGHNSYACRRPGESRSGENVINRCGFGAIADHAWYTAKRRAQKTYTHSFTVKYLGV